MVRATAGVVARTCRARSPLVSVGTGRSPRSPIAAAMVAISSGVVRTLPWPIALEPTARSSPISRAGGIGERAAPPREPSSVLARGRNRRAPRPRQRRRLVEAEALGRGDQPARAEARPERREDGVARLGERLPEAAAAGLAVGVLELDARERRRRAHREVR